LVSLLKQIQPDGSVACCGLAAGPQLPNATVLPFILRGVQLLGVDSVEISRSKKTAVWQKLAHEWACPVTESKARDIGRHELGDALSAFLQGKSIGKIVLDHSLTKA
jgi:NADPH:quinone reductase-like Zn-dependent oxidoreductase